MSAEPQKIHCKKIIHSHCTAEMPLLDFLDCPDDMNLHGKSGKLGGNLHQEQLEQQDLDQEQEEGLQELISISNLHFHQGQKLGYYKMGNRVQMQVLLELLLLILVSQIPSF